MHNLDETQRKRYEELIEKSKEMLDSHKIPYADDIVFGTKKSINSYGSCYYDRLGYPGNYTYRNFKIYLNMVHFEPDVDDDDILNTLLHEILHTSPGCQNHGALWKSHVAKLNFAYELNISVRSNHEKCNGRLHEHRVNSMRYAIYCEGCGIIVRRKNKSAIITNSSQYICGHCNGKLVRNDELATSTERKYFPKKPTEKPVEKPRKPAQRRHRPLKYAVYCESCGTIFRRKVKSGPITNPESYACPLCHGKLIRNDRLATSKEARYSKECA